MLSLKKHKVAAGILGFILAAAGGAFAAWIIATGLSGSAGGKVGAPSTVGAVVLSANTGAAGTLTPGTSANGAYDVVNNSSPAVAETIQTVTVGAITATPACNTSSISFSPAGLVGFVVPAGANGGQNAILSNAWTATSALPTSCANSTLSVALTGTTSP